MTTVAGHRHFRHGDSRLPQCPRETIQEASCELALARVSVLGDGRAAATFSRMLPYGGTLIRDALKKEGRLRGDLTYPDYDFLDLRLNEFHRLLTPTVRPWVHKNGLSWPITDPFAPGGHIRE